MISVRDVMGLCRQESSIGSWTKPHTNNSPGLLSIYHVPDTVWSTWQTWTHVILAAALWGGCWNCGLSAEHLTGSKQGPCPSSPVLSQCRAAAHRPNTGRSVSQPRAPLSPQLWGLVSYTSPPPTPHIWLRCFTHTKVWKPFKSPRGSGTTWKNTKISLCVPEITPVLIICKASTANPYSINWERVYKSLWDAGESVSIRRGFL